VVDYELSANDPLQMIMRLNGGVVGGLLAGKGKKQGSDPLFFKGGLFSSLFFGLDHCIYVFSHQTVTVLTTHRHLKNA